MWQKKEPEYRLSLILGAVSCLNSCAAGSCETLSLPEFPLAGKPVAAELENLKAEDYPAIWEWIGRLYKLKQELDLEK